MKLFTVHDKATDTYSNPVAIPSERDAIESFSMSCNDPKTAHYKHAPDFTLLLLGNFDPMTGSINLLDEKKIITNASALINKDVKNESGSESI